MVSLKNILFVLIFVGLLSVTGCYAGVQESPSLVDSFVVANDISKARADIESSGGYVRHIFFDDKVLIGKMPSDLKSDYIEEIYYYDSSVPSEYSVEFNAWKSVLDWNELSVTDKIKDTPVKVEPLVNDAIYVDDNEYISDKSLPLGATQNDPSSYMLGDIAVLLVYPESNGSVDPNLENWTEFEINSTINETMAGLNWWAERNPNFPLTFVYNYEIRVPTSYEPITRSGNPSNSTLTAWKNEILSQINNGSTNHYTYMHNKRIAMDTDWAVLIFLIDSSQDVDGKFIDGLHAITAMTSSNDGIYSFMTYDNGFYGIDRMDAVLAHEFGHVFGASDQYTDVSYTCDCSQRRGYLYGVNGNCMSCPYATVPSIMKNAVEGFTLYAVDDYLKTQIGWVDSDSDNVLDIFDTETVVSLNQHLPDPDTNNVFNYTGDSIVSIVPAINPYYNDVSIDKVNSVLYRIKLNNEEWSTWMNTISSDGGFDEDNEIYFFAVGPLNWGNYIFQTKALSKFGSYTYDGNYGEDSVAIIGCIDSDNGQNYKIKATTTNFNGSYYGNQTDYCVNLRTLREYYCSGVNIVGVNNNCLYGCADGRCADKSIARTPNIAVSSDGNL